MYSKQSVRLLGTVSIAVSAICSSQQAIIDRHLHVLLHHPQVADAAVFAPFLCVK